MAAWQQIKAVVVDDHPLIRDGMRYMLASYADIEIVGEADTGEAALAICMRELPDVVLLDLNLPDMDGVEVISELRAQNPDVKVVVVTALPGGDRIQEALSSGATSYLNKDVSSGDLANSIRLAYRGTSTFAVAAVQALMGTATSAPPPIGQDLTEREREVLRLIAQGMRNRQIGERLVISTATVDFHIQHLRAKLHASSRTELVSLALRNGLV